MPKFYHIHRGIESSSLEKKFIKNSILFFSKKNSGWYNIEKDISINYNGYRVYEIYIPKTRYTFTFNPRTSGKIVKITVENIGEYIKLKNKYKNYNTFIKEMQKRNIIGIDATIEHIDAYITGPPEGYIWKKSIDVTIRLIETIFL